jgi:hypothetical protein
MVAHEIGQRVRKFFHCPEKSFPPLPRPRNFCGSLA